jgi:fibro-slime domain-containing protein
MPFDGCSSDCQTEPNCESDACKSECGDGIVLNEACDDGNKINGDGCNKECEVEEGFECKQPELGDRMKVAIVLRDFKFGNPRDFQPGAPGRSTALKGMVESTLDGDGKPVYTGISNSLVTSQETFKMWYRDVPGTNSTTASKLELWNNGEGAYVNRYGANGKRFQKTKKAYYCGNVGAEETDENGDPIPCTSIYASETDCSKAEDSGLEVIDCRSENGSYVATIITANIDGNPLFFPVDDDPFTPSSEYSAAQLPAPDYSTDWSYEQGKPKHNFSFTSEVRHWFEFDSGKTYTLDFTGDDDVWVFINKRLAVDLGGIHTPVSGSVTLNAGSANEYGLEDGKVYEIVVFQAERQTTSSSYKLTLSGFNPSPSDCRPICGDGIIGLGEECDDGVNKGGYGQCGPDCTLSEYCGDGVVQGDEDCDDGVNIGNPCPSGCRNLAPVV